jgi:ankyrin repeat protein
VSRCPVNARDAEGRTALFLAAQLGNVDALSALLAAGADPSIADAAGCPPLLAAELAGADAAVGVLVDALEPS